MRNFIKWLIREETDVERLNSREIMLFKMINEKYKELGTKQKIIKHYYEYEPVYAALAGIMLIMLLVLSVLTAVDSFYEIGN